MNEIPSFLYHKLRNQYGEEWTKKIIDGYQSRYTTFRINRLKTTVEKIENILKDNNFLFEKVSWNPDAFLLLDKKEEDLKKLSIYQNGEIYIQSFSSMIPVLFLNPNGQESILDMAAAPGGKTTQISSLTADKALITACEKSATRLERLKYNIEKQGARRITVLKEDARYLDDFFSFDKILLDAPCSGSGTIDRNNPKLFSYFTETLIQKSSKVQRELLEKAIHLLKPGGTMIYSTCSILEEENEKVVEEFVKKNMVSIEPIELSDIPTLPTKLEGTLLVCPTNRFEGFFVVKLKKRG